MGNYSALFLWALSFSLRFKVSNAFNGWVRWSFSPLNGNKFLILSKKQFPFFYPLNEEFLFQCCKPVMELPSCLWCLAFSWWQVGLCWRYATLEQRAISRLTWPTTREVQRGWPLRYLKASMRAVIRCTEYLSWVVLCTRFPSLKKITNTHWKQNFIPRVTNIEGWLSRGPFLSEDHHLALLELYSPDVCWQRNLICDTNMLNNHMNAD